MAKFVVGLTGGICSGKTTVANLFAALGINVIDADQIAREVVLPGTPAYAAIVEHFGPQILTSAQTINRQTLRAIILQDPAKRLWLEQLLHPVILAKMTSLAKNSTSPYCILVIPLLIEILPYPVIKRILVVDTPIAIQVARLTQRDQATPQEIEALLAAQVDRATRNHHADDIIHNDADLNNLKQQVDTLHHMYLAKSKAFKL